MTMKFEDKLGEQVIYNFVINKFHIRGHYNHEFVNRIETTHAAI